MKEQIFIVLQQEGSRIAVVGAYTDRKQALLETNKDIDNRFYVPTYIDGQPEYDAEDSSFETL